MSVHVAQDLFYHAYKKMSIDFENMLFLRFDKKKDAMNTKQELERLRRELVEAEKKVSQYRNQEKIILNKARDKERRNRTRRLIEHGAILENVLPVRDMDAEELTALLAEISLLPVVSKMLDAYKKDGDGSRFSERRIYTP